VGLSYADEAVHAAHFAGCLLDAGRADVARVVMERHGKTESKTLTPTRDEADVAAVWRRLQSPSR
jgi:hypothetical protein